MTGVELITQERKKQIEVNGWTAERDDGHAGGALAIEAAALTVNLRA